MRCSPRRARGLQPWGIPGSPGVPPAAVVDTVVLPYNDLDFVVALFNRTASGVAAVIVVLVAGNMGCVPPEPGFLDGLRSLHIQMGCFARIR